MILTLKMIIDFLYFLHVLELLNSNYPRENRSLRRVNIRLKV